MMNNSLIKVVAVVFAVGVVLGLSGCKDDGPSSKIFVKNGSSDLPRIAVVPFDAVGNVRSQDAGRVVTNTVLTYLLSTGLFEVVDPGQLDDALVSNQIRIGEGLKKGDLLAIQKSLDVDAVIIGLVEEYGDVRVGNDSYPSVSFSARLVNAHTGTIVWAGTISKTGADRVTVFDIGRISSMGKLCKSAVQDMARSMTKTYDRVKIALADTGPTEHIASSDVPATPATPDTTLATGAAANMVVTPAVATIGKSTDGSGALGEDELRALIPEIPGFVKGDFDFNKHANPTLEGRYTIDGGKQFVEVKLVDYSKKNTALSFVQMYHPGEDSVKFAGLQAFIKTTDFGYEHVDLAIGRFGLFVRGPVTKKDDLERAAEAIATAIK